MLEKTTLQRPGHSEETNVAGVLRHYPFGC
jgi:hypothetical protein